MKKRLRRTAPEAKLAAKPTEDHVKIVKEYDEGLVDAGNSIFKHRIDQIEEEMHRRKNFRYENRRYLDKIRSNEVIVTQCPDVKILDMIPRVSIIEDVQFRKALPKSYKHF